MEEKKNETTKPRSRKRKLRQIDEDAPSTSKPAPPEFRLLVRWHSEVGQTEIHSLRLAAINSVKDVRVRYVS